MKLTLNWLRDFVEIAEKPQAVADAFNSLGFAVEQMIPLVPNFRDVTIGKVAKVVAHPDADRLRICQVDVSSEVLQIVCGAWNFEVGSLVPVAVPGAVIGGDLEIGRRRIRGATSNGMICSESELGIGEYSDGIMVLNDDYPAAEDLLGANFSSLLEYPDTFFDLEVNPNRPDAMSVRGLARELSAYFAIPLRELDISLEKTSSEMGLCVKIEDPQGCPRFVGREVRDLKIKPSPHWIRFRLENAGIRPINNVVDASNYVMLEMGHPTHAFDADRVGAALTIRRAKEEEQILLLDGSKRDLTASDIVVADGDKSIAIAGVMGGTDTEVTANTTRVLLEAAYWHPPSILLTSKRLGLRSEASARFERGVDPNFCNLAADRVAQLLVEHAGGSVGSSIDVYPSRISPREVALPLSEVSRILGVQVSGVEISHFLESLGFAISGEDPLLIQVPTRRPDVTRSVDLIEEIGRLYGFENIPERIATGPGGGLETSGKRRRKLRYLLAGAGLHETLNFSFIGSADLDALDLPSSDSRRDGVRIINPLREEEGVMRTTLLPGLLKAVAINQARQLGSVGLFEIGTVFISGSGELPEQPEYLAFALAGDRDGDFSRNSREVDVRDATGLWELIADDMRLPNVEQREVTRRPFHPGRAAELEVNKDVIGVVGEIHPSVARRFGITGRVVAGELNLAPLTAPRDTWTFTAPSPYPPAVFDLAFELDTSSPVSALLTAARVAAGEILESVNVFDVFIGPPLNRDMKSVAIRVTLRSPERTLTEQEAADVRRSIAAAVETRTGGALRGEL